MSHLTYVYGQSVILVVGALFGIVAFIYVLFIFRLISEHGVLGQEITPKYV